MSFFLEYGNKRQFVADCVRFYLMGKKGELWKYNRGTNLTNLYWSPTL